MANKTLHIAAYDANVDDVVESFNRLKEELEESTGFPLRKQDVWLKIIRAGIKVLEAQKIS